jgi:hypothetical protein
MKVPKERIWGFVVSTARHLGFRTRITLHNKSGVDVVAGLLVRDQDGERLVRVPGVAELASGSAKFFEVDELLRSVGLEPPEGEESVLNFHLIPKAHLDADGPVEIEKAEVFRILTAQDHYLEHYDPKTGFASGVLYQTPHVNDPLFFPKSSFLMQAPKVFLSEHRNTVAQVLFYSSDPDFSGTGDLHFGLRGGGGNLVVTWTETLPAHGVRFVDMKEVLARHGLDWKKVVDRHGFLFLEAASADHGFIPIMFNLNRTMHTFDMEHSLPPLYYGSKLTGPRKGEIIAAAVKALKAPVAAQVPAPRRSRP